MRVGAKDNKLKGDHGGSYRRRWRRNGRAESLRFSVPRCSSWVLLFILLQKAIHCIGLSCRGRTEEKVKEGSDLGNCLQSAVAGIPRHWHEEID